MLLLLLLPAVVVADNRPPDVLRIDSGPISGRTESGVHLFLGIPYAAPPVGSLRWRPPQAVTPWKQVRPCNAFGPSCPQPQQKDTGTYSEDCLYLNVWTPATRPGERLPVVVWIHGGAFNFGSASMPDYDGRNLARKGVVVVSINYRLGPLGFLVHPLLSRESGAATSGNYGLLDQIAALKWVQTNIPTFGGDPKCVTVMGQSAGSKSVTLLMISPLAAGLFHRAIAESGGPILGSEFLTPAFDGDMARASRTGQDLAARMGCDRAPDVLATMRSVPAQDVVKAAQCRGCVLDDQGPFFAPVFDGTVLPRDPVAAYSSGKQHDVPLIIGTTLNEGYWFFHEEKDLSVERYRSFLRSRFGDHDRQAFEMFPARAETEVPAALDRLLTVASVAQPSRFVAQGMEHTRSGAYLFQFTRRPDTAMVRKMGVHHGVELPYVFGNLAPSAGYDDADLELSRMIMQYWVNFARTGNPNGKGLPGWPRYASDTDRNMEFSDHPHARQHLFKTECDFIRRLPAYRSADRPASLQPRVQACSPR